MSKKKAVFRGVRKSAYLTRKITSKAANFSGRVEKKADRIIHGTDPTVQIHQKVLQEQIFSDALPEITPIHPALSIPGRSPVVNLLIPSLQNSSFFGGTATALILAALLANKKGVPLRITETLKHGKAKTESIQDFLASENIDMPSEKIKIMDLAGRKYNHYGYIDIHPDDTFIVSAWWDAHLLDTLPLNKKFLYLIQDFEPIFYNNSDKYILAEETYNNKTFVPVFNTKIMRDFMASKNYSGIESDSIYFEPAINVGKKFGYNTGNGSGKKQLFIYGRPSVHRNLFYRALDAVDKAFASGALDANEWEVSMAGQDKLPNILLDCGVTVFNKGKMDLNEYYEFAKTIDIGLSLMMAPHPSYPPLELASMGACVVTTSYENKTDLTSYSKNIIVTDGTITSLVEGLKQASKIPHETRLENAKEANISSNWNNALEDSVQEIYTLI